MTKDNFILLILGMIFVAMLFSVFLQYISLKLNAEALSKPNESVYNVYQMPKENAKKAY
jgi:predicted RND superfamily exporter protein